MPAKQSSGHRAPQRRFGTGCDLTPRLGATNPRMRVQATCCIAACWYAHVLSHIVRTSLSLYIYIYMYIYICRHNVHIHIYIYMYIYVNPDIVLKHTHVHTLTHWLSCCCALRNSCSNIRLKHPIELKRTECCCIGRFARLQTVSSGRRSP